MRLANLLLLIAPLRTVLTILYLSKNPRAEGEPFGRERTLMLIPMFLAFCCLVAASILILADLERWPGTVSQAKR